MEMGLISSNKGFQDIELFGNRVKCIAKLAANEVGTENCYRVFSVLFKLSH